MANSRIQGAGAVSVGFVASITCTFPSGTTAGNAIVVAAVTGDGATSGAACTVTDNASPSNTYTQSAINTNIGATTVGIEFKHALSITAKASPHTITFTPSSSMVMAVAIAEVNNLTASPVDQSSFASGTSTTPASGAKTTTNADEYLMGMMADISGVNATLTPNASWSQVAENQNANGGGSFLFNDEDRVVTSTGSYNAQWTISASHTWLAGMCTYKATSTAGGTTFQPSLLLMGIG